MTGSLLTAALALAVVDPVTLESLRRSAATLFLGTERAGPVETPALTTGAPAAAPAEPPVAASAARALAALRAEIVGESAPARHAPTDVAPADRPGEGGSTLPSTLSESERHESGPGGEPPEDGPRPMPAAADAIGPSGGVVGAPGPVPGAESGLGSESETGEPAGLAGSGDRLPPPDADGPGSWHAFWTPFHSEASAAGFARHLERMTGERYRVIRTGPGAYRVAFWHADDTERSLQLLAIERASGLSLRGGEL
jgi:hypothetical protein